MNFLRLRVAVCGVFASILAASPGPSGQTPPDGRETSAAAVASFCPRQQMPVDPEVVVGTLPNGLRYYVRANGKPGHRAELRLVRQGRSVLAKGDQHGGG